MVHVAPICTSSKLSSLVAHTWIVKGIANENLRDRTKPTYIFLQLEVEPELSAMLQCATMCCIPCHREVLLCCGEEPSVPGCTSRIPQAQEENAHQGKQGKRLIKHSYLISQHC